jgi:hypothetical protein
MKASDRDPRRPNRRSATLALLGLLATLPGRAVPVTAVPVEVNALLGYVERSGCEFQRNFVWHSSLEAQAHLRAKFDYLAARNQLDSTEQFIERVASQSSLTGRAYMVRCNGGPAITSRQWLSDELMRLRKKQ